MYIIPTADDQVKPTTEIHAKKQQKQEYKFISSMRRIKGLVLFSFNLDTIELKQVEIEKKVSIGMDGKAIKKNKVQHDPRLIYVQAINRKVAAKKIAKEIDAYC